MSAFRSVAALAAALLLSSCSARTIVGLDEAFAAARPGLAASIREGCGPFSGARYATISLAEGPSGLLSEAFASRPEVIVTSPLFARALLEAERASATGGRASGGPGGGARLIAVEWRGPLPGGLSAAVTSPERAYGRAGAAAGAYIKALRASQGSQAEGALLFLTSPERGGGARDAFVEAFARAAGFPPLLREAADEAGALAGLEELSGSDLGLLFVAAGPIAPELCAKAARPGLAIGIAGNSEALFPEAAFGVFPDDQALASALRSLASKKAKKAGELVSVPARLSAGPNARLYQAGSSNLERFIARANSEINTGE